MVVAFGRAILGSVDLEVLAVPFPTNLEGIGGLSDSWYEPPVVTLPLSPLSGQAQGRAASTTIMPLIIFQHALVTRAE